MAGYRKTLIALTSLFVGFCAGWAAAAPVKVFDSAETPTTTVDFRFASNRLITPFGYERAGVFTLGAPQALSGFNILAKPTGDSAQFSDEIFPLTVSFFEFDGTAPKTAPIVSLTATSLVFEPLRISGENTFRISGSFDEVDLRAGSHLFLIRAATRNFELIGRDSPGGSAEFGRATPDGEWRPYAFGPAKLDFELFSGVLGPMTTVPAPGGLGLLLAALSALALVRRWPLRARSALSARSVGASAGDCRMR